MNQFTYLVREYEDYCEARIIRFPPLLSQVVWGSGLVESRSDAKRLIRQGGVYLDGIRQSADGEVDVASLNGRVLRIGKRRMVRFRQEDIG